MEKRWDIFGVGTAAVDDLLTLPRFPLPDEKMPVQSAQRQGGGQTATALVAAARHGARTAFYSRLGDDALSTYTIVELEREGVDCRLVQRAPGAGPVHAVILVDASSGSRTILFNSAAVQELDPESIDPGWIQASRVLFIDQNVPYAGLRAAQIAQASGVPVIADLERNDMPHLDTLLGCIDHLIVSTSFAKQVTGNHSPEGMVQALARTGRASTVVTCGERGCWYTERDGPALYFPAYPVQAVDTTGCGDVFHGAYAAAIARGEPVAWAVKIASATAAKKALHAGGRAGIPDRATAEALARTV